MNNSKHREIKTFLSVVLATTLTVMWAPARRGRVYKPRYKTPGLAKSLARGANKTILHEVWSDDGRRDPVERTIYGKNGKNKKKNRAGERTIILNDSGNVLENLYDDQRDIKDTARDNFDDDFSVIEIEERER